MGGNRLVKLVDAPAIVPRILDTVDERQRFQRPAIAARVGEAGFEQRFGDLEGFGNGVLRFAASGESPRLFPKMGVDTPPGQTQLTLMPDPASSEADVRVNWMTPAFAAL